jgi:uncharacterized protein YdaU (DUF1376 family)
MKLIWYAFHPNDYARDTAHLSMIEHGAYRLLLDHYYMSGVPLPASAMHLHRICRAFADDEQAAVHSVLQQFFTLTDDGWRHERVEAELAKSDDISEKRRRAAVLRHKKGKSDDVDNSANADANADACALQMDTQSQSHTHISTTGVVDMFTPQARKQRLPEGFHPNDTGIEKARQAGINLAAELEAFRDYHTSKGTTMLDWQAAWRTWVGNAVKFKGKKPSNGFKTSQEKRAEMVRQLTGEAHDESYIIDQQ